MTASGDPPLERKTRRRTGGFDKETFPLAGERLPRLRPLDPVPIQRQGERWIALHDPAGWVAEPFAVPPAFAFLLQFFDGRHTARDVQKAYAEATGEFLFQSHLEKLVGQLDEACLLDTPRFQSHKEHLARAYRQAPRRVPVHAGKGYAASGAALAAEIDAFLDAAAPPALPGGEVAALVLPHTPPRAAGRAYAAACAPLREEEPVDLCVVLGTHHGGLAHGFAVTDKDYETPLGVLPTARDLVAAVAARLPEAAEEDYAHRAERSIEYPAVFLQRLFRGRGPRRILPVLCGFGVADARAAAQGRVIQSFLEVLEDVVRGAGGRVLWVAGVDLSHVGPRYGDERPLSREDLAALAIADRETLEPALARDAAAFLDAVAAVQEKRRICGFPALYGLLRLLPAGTGYLADYLQHPADDLGSHVSCAGLVFSAR